MNSWIIAALALLVGFGFGAVAIAAYWLRLFRKPEFTRRVLESLRRNAQGAHPHWLNELPGEGNVCPCCGWQAQPLPEIGPGDLCGVRRMTVTWATLSDGRDAVGKKADLEELIRHWELSDSHAAGLDTINAIRKYTGNDPADREALSRELKDWRKQS